MEHYDWNDGWLFTPEFTPALVGADRPQGLEEVRIPHTVRPLPYNYCNENDYQLLCGYRREFFAPKEWEGRIKIPLNCTKPPGRTAMEHYDWNDGPHRAADLWCRGP